MGAVTAILPYITGLLKLVPTLIDTGQIVYDGAKKLWESVTAKHPATPEEQAEFDAAEQAAFDALMKSTEDVAEDESA